jgi:hypothetical protein
MEYIGPIAQLITAMVLAATFVQSFRNGQKANQIAEAVSKIKEQTNGINAQLVRATGEVKFAEGVKHGEKYAERNDVRTEPNT